MFYNEDKHLNVVRDYIKKTYEQHYTSDSGEHKLLQLQDVLINTGHAESFYVGNAMKYLWRYGKKDGKNKKDILKTIHYLILLLDLNHGDNE